MSCTQSTLVCLLPQVAIVPSSQVKYPTMQYSLGVPDRLRGAVANKPESVGQAVKSEKKLRREHVSTKKRYGCRKQWKFIASVHRLQPPNMACYYSQPAKPVLSY